MRGYYRADHGYPDITAYERSISLPVSTGLGAALGAIVRPVVLSQFTPQRGYEDITDWERSHSTPISTALFGRRPRESRLAGMAGIFDEAVAAGAQPYVPGADEQMTQPVENPRDSDFWSFLQKGFEVVPTAAVKVVDAYKTYETAGGGAAGVNKAVIDIFGKQAAQSAQQVAAAQQAAAARVAASAKPWYSNPAVLVGGGLLAAFGIYAATKR